MKKEIIIGLLVIGLLLSGCQNNELTEPTESGGNQTYLSAEYSAQNKYLLTSATSFQETDGFFCGTNLTGNYLQYYDKDTGISGVLCADPACSHDSVECGAYMHTKVDRKSVV